MQLADCEAILVTQSEHGMTLVPRRGEVVHVPAHPVKVRDVSGAGDTAVATYVYDESETYHGHAERYGSVVLLAHNFFDFRCRHWSNCNHFSVFTPCRFRRYLVQDHYSTGCKRSTLWDVSNSSPQRI